VLFRSATANIGLMSLWSIIYLEGVIMFWGQSIKSIIVGVSAGFLLSACGAKSGGEMPATDPNKETVDIPISFMPDTYGASETGLALAASATAASSYVMNLSGCKSGLSGNITTSTVKLYVGDSSCIIKLSSFLYNGNTYLPKTSFGFSTWLASDVATFVNQSNASDIFSVKVLSQLTQSLISSSDVVGYSFYQTISGATQSVAQSITSQSQSLAVSGMEAPNFVLSTNGSPAATGSVAPVVFSGVDSNGYPQLVFKLYCSYAMGSSGACGLSSSDTGAIPLTAITYKLVGDSYGVNTGTSLTSTQLASIMSSGTSTINTSTDVLSDNNKGFKTSTLVGPGPLQTNPNLILVLSDGNSYTYFSVQFSVISNN